MNIVTDVVLPIALAFIMFSLGLGLSISDFTRIFLKPKEFFSWAINFRRLTWLRTMTWFARYQVAWQNNKHPAVRNKGMTKHVANHITHSFHAETIAEARSDWLEPRLLTMTQQ